MKSVIVLSRQIISTTLLLQQMVSMLLLLQQMAPMLLLLKQIMSMLLLLQQMVSMLLLLKLPDANEPGFVFGLADNPNYLIIHQHISNVEHLTFQ
jgi:hypothetical protein